MTITHNFIFTGPSTMDEVRGTLRLAELAVESIYGHDRVHLETHATLDEQLRCCAIDTSSWLFDELMLRRRPILIFPFAPPASTVATFLQLCMFGSPMSLVM